MKKNKKSMSTCMCLCRLKGKKKQNQNLLGSKFSQSEIFALGLSTNRGVCRFRQKEISEVSEISIYTPTTYNRKINR